MENTGGKQSFVDDISALDSSASVKHTKDQVIVACQSLLAIISSGFSMKGQNAANVASIFFNNYSVSNLPVHGLAFASNEINTYRNITDSWRCLFDESLREYYYGVQTGRFSEAGLLGNTQKRKNIKKNNLPNEVVIEDPEGAFTW
jgi:hypothetical protein